jgi:hypothetical protein
LEHSKSPRRLRIPHETNPASRWAAIAVFAHERALRQTLRSQASAAGNGRRSMNTEIVDRLDVLFQREALEKEIGGVIEQAVHETATKTAKRLLQELRQSGLIPDQMARAQEATKHLAPPDKEEHSK